MKLAEVVIVDSSLSSQEAINLAASVEQESVHPVAVGLKDAATELQEIETAEVIAGQGVSASVAGKLCWVGRPSSMTPPDSHANWIVLARENSMQVEDSQKMEVLAWFRFSDELREGAEEAIRGLKSKGKKVLVYSGDGSRAGRDQVEDLPLDDSCLGATPDEKIEGIRGLQRDGQRVLMVGDGLNDAGALAVADVSLAVNPVDVVVQSAADATLVRPELKKFVDLFGYAERVHGIIRQNLLWAFVYNMSVIPLAIAGFIPPWVAALGMSLSSLLVTLNAGRLVRTD